MIHWSWLAVPTVVAIIVHFLCLIFFQTENRRIAKVSQSLFLPTLLKKMALNSPVTMKLSVVVDQRTGKYDIIKSGSEVEKYLKANEFVIQNIINSTLVSRNTRNQKQGTDLKKTRRRRPQTPRPEDWTL